MGVFDIHADLSSRVSIDTEALDWQPSPSRSVWRKRLYLDGEAEAGRVTSIVRYDPGSSFHAHDHPDGEEILVLDGVFSDEHGDWPKGTYLLNPEGFRHRPFSKDGCLLFVRLRQYPGTDRTHVVVGIDDASWQSDRAAGVATLTLYAEERYPDTVQVARWGAGAKPGGISYPDGVEIFVIEGSFEDETERYARHHWLRLPAGSRHEPFTVEGCTLFVKSRLACAPLA